MEIDSTLLDNFFEYAVGYLGHPVKRVTIVESRGVVPKMDELTTEYEQYTHLFQYWEELRGKSK